MNSNKINILFTGLSGNDSALQSLIKSDKVNFIHFPTIEIRKSELSREEKNKINNADSYDFLIFTSINAAKYFLQLYENDFSTLSYTTNIVAIGEKTASVLLNNNIDVDLISNNSSSESLDELLTEKLVSKKTILIPGSRLSRVNLFNSLKVKGAMVDFITIYENEIPEKISNIEKEKIRNTKINLIVFTSPSTFYNFVSIFNVDDVKEYFSDKVIATLGPVTKRALEQENLSVEILPSKYNLNSLTTEIRNYYKLN
ncbi:MAG: uroporphyrinogen-III synthase [Melioribacteraceae bacterium]|nr:uroporphyrinogen-III synthase [Melioribacteraceae bacterium]